MKKPLQQDDALLNDIAHTRALRDGHLRLWWLGQSGFLIQYDTRHLLIDPYLSDSLSLKYADTDKPHTRITERVVDPAALRDIFLITSSHAHTDHLDSQTLIPLIRGNPDLHFVTSRANLRVAEQRLARDVDLPLEAGQQLSVDGINIHAIPSAHNSVTRDDTGSCLYQGYIFKIGSVVVYHSGDTLLYDGMIDLLKPFNIDIALLPINGDRPERRVAGNLSGKEAAQLAKDIHAKLVIPCHYDMFEFNTADPADEFIPECERLGQPYKVLQQGERWSSSELP